MYIEDINFEFKNPTSWTINVHTHKLIKHLS